ncbi:hypothetical protein TNCV_3519781 [Trichonephila clavipes]|nr:hypothetical protein TNCV_3519781 [Trichonephila clavipes]
MENIMERRSAPRCMPVYEDVGLPGIKNGTEKQRSIIPWKNIALKPEKNEVFTAERYLLPFAEETSKLP